MYVKPPELDDIPFPADDPLARLHNPNRGWWSAEEITGVDGGDRVNIGLAHYVHSVEMVEVQLARPSDNLYVSVWLLADDFFAACDSLRAFAAGCHGHGPRRTVPGAP